MLLPCLVGSDLHTLSLYRYVERYGLDAPCDDIESVLKRVALKLGKTRKVKVLTGTGKCSSLQERSSGGVVPPISKRCSHGGGRLMWGGGKGSRDAL